MAPRQVAGGVVQNFYLGGSSLTTKEAPASFNSPRRYSGDDDRHLELYIS